MTTVQINNALALPGPADNIDNGIINEDDVDIVPHGKPDTAETPTDKVKKETPVVPYYKLFRYVHLRPLCCSDNVPFTILCVPAATLTSWMQF